MLSDMDVDSFANVVSHANNLLIYKRFEECISCCQNGLWNAKAFPESDRACQTSEALSLVALQAYAELDRWQEVLPFINHIYCSIENFPTAVVDACVRLHAHVEDYLTCTAMCSVWLRHPDNLQKPEYSQLVETFVDCVLVVQRRWQDVKPFLENCPGLDKTSREYYIKQADKLRKHIEQETIDTIETVPTEPNMLANDDENTLNHSIDSENTDPLLVAWHTVGTWAKKIVASLSSHLQIMTQPRMKNATLFIILLYILFSRSNFDALSYSWWYKTWSVLKRLWRAMFSPFYLAKQ